jgi:hypothetical protein
MPFKTPQIPQILTYKDWQKKKGLVAKIVGKTGIGDAMKNVEKAHKSVNWKLLDIGVSSPQGKACTREALKKTFDNAGAEFKSKVEGKLRKEIIALRDTAKKTSVDWQKNKKIPKKSTAHVKEVHKAADYFMVACNAASISTVVKKDYEDNLKGIEASEKVMAGLSNKLKRYCVAVAKELNSITTKKEFDGKFWSENIRGIGTTLPVLAKDLGLAKEHKIWRVFASEGFKPGSDEEVAAKLNQIKPVLKKIIAKLK